MPRCPTPAIRAATIGLPRLVHARAEPGVAGQFGRGGEAADVAELGGDRVGEDPADPGHAEQQWHVAVLGAEPAQLQLAAGDLPVELVDQVQARVDRCGSGLRQREPAVLSARLRAAPTRPSRHRADVRAVRRARA